MNNNSMFGQNSQFNQNWNQNGNQSQNTPNNPLEALISQYLQSQQQTTQKPPQIPVIPGRMVMNEEEIKANEIPMDGTTSLFVKNDFTRIWAKTWNSNGSINTFTFVLEQAPVQNTSSDEDLRTQIFNRLDKIDNTLNTITSKPYYSKQNKYNKQGGNKPKQQEAKNDE